jgi:hypothetical protein
MIEPDPKNISNLTLIEKKLFSLNYLKSDEKKIIEAKNHSNFDQLFDKTVNFSSLLFCCLTSNNENALILIKIVEILEELLNS